MRTTALTVGLTLSIVLLFPACGPADKPAPTAATASVQAGLPSLTEAANHDLAQAAEGLDTLLTRVEALTDQPSADHLKGAQAAWQKAYGAFNRTLPLLLGNPATTKLVGTRLDPLPIEPGYVDALKEWPDSGIVNDSTLKLDAASLIEQNQIIDATQPSLGFQVIEFLLWGNESLPRKVSDFRFKRRTTYLRLAAQQLQQDMHAVNRQLASEGTDADAGLVAAHERLARAHTQAADPNFWIATPTLAIIEQASQGLPKSKTLPRATSKH